MTSSTESPDSSRPPEFVDVDLSGARFEQVRLNDSRFRMVRFDGSTFKNISWHGVRMTSVELVDVEITGDVWNVVINGVDVGPLINDELNRRDPDRALLFPTHPDHGSVADLRRAWEVVSQRWADAIAQVHALPAGAEHRSVGGEWSLVQTLRHVSYALAVWVERVALGRTDALAPTDLPWDEAPPEESAALAVGRDTEVALEEAVAQWERRRDTVRDLLARLDDEDLRTRRVDATSEGYPQVRDFPLREAIFIGMSETWEHHGFAKRDLDLMEAELTR